MCTMENSVAPDPLLKGNGVLISGHCRKTNTEEKAKAVAECRLGDIIYSIACIPSYLR